MRRVVARIRAKGIGSNLQLSSRLAGTGAGGEGQRLLYGFAACALPALTGPPPPFPAAPPPPAAAARATQLRAAQPSR